MAHPLHLNCSLRPAHLQLTHNDSRAWLLLPEVDRQAKREFLLRRLKARSSIYGVLAISLD